MGLEPSSRQPIDPDALRLEIETMRRELGYPEFSDGADIMYGSEADVPGTNGHWWYPRGGNDNGLCTAIQVESPLVTAEFRHALGMLVAIQESIARPAISPADHPGLRPILNEIARGEFPGEVGSTFAELIQGETSWYRAKRADGSVEPGAKFRIEQRVSRDSSTNNQALLGILAVQDFVAVKA
jgi:hypothetical protein